MEKAIAVVGGDLRIIKLVEMLIADGYTVYTYGLEYSEELLKLEGVEMCPTLNDALKDTKAVVGPIPLSSDRKHLSTPFSNVKLTIEDFVEELNGKTLIAGNITEPIRAILDEKSIYAAGVDKGERKKQLEVAKKMKSKNIDVDTIIESLSKIIANGINIAIQPNMDMEEINKFMN